MTDNKFKILAYGLDILEFQEPENMINEFKNTVIEYKRIDDEFSFENYHGIIIPQGIFEKIEFHTNVLDETFTEVRFKRDLLLEREREAGSESTLP